MAQVNFLHDDVGCYVSGINGNGTSAITAGDLLYASGPSTSPFGTTVPSGVDYDEIEVEPIKWATAVLDENGGRMVGMALHDAAAGSQITFITRGLVLSPIIDTTGYVQAGMPVRAAEGTTTAGVTNCGTTTGPAGSEIVLKIGRALCSGNVDGDYILWLLNIH